MFTLITQNLGKTGKPFFADIICSQETKRSILEEARPNHTHFGRGEDFISFDPQVVTYTKGNAILLNEGIKGVAPKRHLIELMCHPDEIHPHIEVAILNAHMINAAWSPVEARVANWKMRRSMWKQEAKIIRERRAFHRSQGRQVFINGDMNRLGDDWSFATQEVIIGRPRLDRMFYTKGPFVLQNKTLLAKVGEGAVTHNGIKARYELR